MPTYVQDFDYTLHAVKRVTYQLKVVEDVEVPKKRSKITISIIRTNSGEEVDSDRLVLKLKINDEAESEYNTSGGLDANSSDEKFKITKYLDHNSSGGGSLRISARLKCDHIGTLTNLIYGTIADAEISESLTPIDLSVPTVNNIVTSANRYGTGVSIAFNASHKTYPLTSIEFTLSGLTLNQSYYRRSKATQADTSTYSETSDGTYDLILKKGKNLTTSNEIFFDLDDYKDGEYPLDSGGSYPWSMTVTAYNGKTTTRTGILKVPQKVTGVTCETQLDVTPSSAVLLDYQVQPSNAEDLSVTFQSSDKTVATVDENGLITAVGDGVCQITVTTVDGGSLDAVSGFSSACTVTVLNTDVFPDLSEIRYLAVREIAKLSFACIFLHDKLIEKGIVVPELSEVICEGKSHPVKEIKSLLETIEANCQLLKSASSSAYPTESLTIQRDIIGQNTEKNWYFIVNEWIRFLNELNTQIEKEA